MWQRKCTWLDHFPCEAAHKKWNLGSSKHLHLPRIFFRSRKLMTRTSSRLSNSHTNAIRANRLFSRPSMRFVVDRKAPSARRTNRIENANQRVRCQICHSKKSTINLVNQIRNKLNSLTDKSSGIPGNVIQKRHLFKTRKRKAPQAREKMRFWCKHSTNMVFESAAGAPKNQVFLDQVSCRTPPRGGGGVGWP